MSRRRRKYYDPGATPFPQAIVRVSSGLHKKRPATDADRRRLERAEAKRARRGKR